MTDPLVAHASPSDTSSSPDWEEDRPGQGDGFTHFVAGMGGGEVVRRSALTVTRCVTVLRRHSPDSTTGT